MFVLLHHIGEYSTHVCSVIGVFETEELAKQAIDDLLQEQIDKESS